MKFKIKNIYFNYVKKILIYILLSLIGYILQQFSKCSSFVTSICFLIDVRQILVLESLDNFKFKTFFLLVYSYFSLNL